MRNILFDLLKTNENIELANNASSICLSDVILPASLPKAIEIFISFLDIILADLLRPLISGIRGLFDLI